MKPKQYTLRADVYSGKKALYGKKGARVREIADHDNVLIVEDARGQRFPVHKDLLKEYTPITI